MWLLALSLAELDPYPLCLLMCKSAVLVLMHFWLFRDEATSLDRGVVSNGKTALFMVTIGSAVV